MQPRYAVYYVPEKGTPLERFGSSLLGRSIHTDERLSQPQVENIPPEELYSITEDARRYGLHATLKPPFFLKPGVTEADLVAIADSFARKRKAMPLPDLTVERFNSFFALRMRPQNDAEAEEAEDIRRFAEEVVRRFDAFRASPSPEELARRREKGLTPRQENLLGRWGYPYVLEEFRFHITLTDSITDTIQAGQLAAFLQEHMKPVVGGNAIRSLSLCRSDENGAFSVLHRAELAW